MGRRSRSVPKGHSPHAELTISGNSSPTIRIAKRCSSGYDGDRGGADGNTFKGKVVRWSAMAASVDRPAARDLNHPAHCILESRAMRGTVRPAHLCLLSSAHASRNGLGRTLIVGADRDLKSPSAARRSPAMAIRSP